MDNPFNLDQAYLKHPAVEQGVTNYVLFKKRARELRRAVDIPLSLAQQKQAKSLGFRDFHEAQAFYLTHRPDFYATPKTKAKRSPEEQEAYDYSWRIEQWLKANN